MTGHRIKHWYVAITSLIIFIGLGVTIFYSIIDGVYYKKPLVFDSNILTTDKQVYKPGDQIWLTWNLCKNRPSTAIVNFAFINEVVVAMPEITRNLPVGCYDQPIFNFKIPECIHEGDFIMKGTVVYHINPMKTITYDVQSTTFIIKK